jgi:pimeloyl-ACP methyl ester carboxylesterase
MQTLIMIPGLCSDAVVWRRTIAALNDEIDCLVGDTLSGRSLLSTAQRILDHAPETFALAGVSMGGMVALETMKIAPECVTRLALIDTNARPDAIARMAYRPLANIVAISSDCRSAVPSRWSIHPRRMTSAPSWPNWARGWGPGPTFGKTARSPRDGICGLSCQASSFPQPWL